MGSHLQGFQEEPQQDEILSALGYFLSSSSGQFSSSEYKTEPEREHKVLHWQQRHRLNSLGSCPGCRHSVLCQPGVQPVQGWWQPRGHQGRQQEGNKHQVPWINPLWIFAQQSTSFQTRFFLGNNNPVGNGLVGFLGGFGTAAVTHSLLGSPCG